jgi:Aspartyl protease
MKLIVVVLSVFYFSGCGLISFVRYDKATKQERIVQKSFKQEIPFLFVNGFIIVEVEIEGKKQGLVFDTGASTILDDSFAKTIKYSTLGSQKHTDILGKSDKIKLVKLNKITVGKIDFEPVVAGISSMVKFNEQTCNKVVGIFGANMMNKAVWQIDYKRKCIVFADSRDSFSRLADARTFNFYCPNNKTPQIRIVAGDQYLGDADLDTGANQGIELPNNQLVNIPQTNGFIKKRGISNGLFSESIETGQTTWVSSLVLGGGFEVKNAQVTFSSQLGKCNIGNDFLKDYLVTIDWKYQEVTLANFIPKSDSSLFSFGFAPSYKNGKILIASIVEQSSADKLGLLLNDQIVGIDGVDLSNPSQADYCLVKGFFNQVRDKNRMLVSIRRGNERIEFEVLKTDLRK